MSYLYQILTKNTLQILFNSEIFFHSSIFTFRHYLNKTVVVTNLQKIVLGRKIEQDLEESSFYTIRERHDFPLAVESRVNSWEPWDSFPVHEMTAGLFWRLHQNTSSLVVVSTSRQLRQYLHFTQRGGISIICECERGEGEVSGTWYPQSGQGDGDFCSWKSASPIMLGQFSYMLFASLKYVKSCHVKLIPLALF